MSKESFLIYKSFYEPTKLLSLEHKGLLYTAIMEYQMNGTIIDLPSEVRMAFSFFLNQFRLDDQKYLEKCNKNKENVSKRWNNKNTNEYDRIQTDTKHTYNDNDNDNDLKNNNSKELLQKSKKVKKTRKIKEFTPPTLEQVKEYVEEKECSSELAEKFYEYFTVGNWTDSEGKKVKNWKQKFLTWKGYRESKPPDKSTTQKEDFYDKWQVIGD